VRQSGQGSADRRGHRNPLHIRPRHPRRGFPGRTQGEGHPPLGLRRPRHPGGSQALRQPLLTTGPRKRPGRTRLQIDDEPQIPRDTEPMPPRTLPRLDDSGGSLPVRTPGLLLRGQRFNSRATGLQQDRHPSGFLGQNSEDPAEKVGGWEVS